MGDSGVSEDDIIGQIDWEHLLDDIPEDMNLFAVDDLPPVSDSSADASAKELSNPSPDSVSSWIGEIEHLLMNDDDDNHTAVVEPNHQICNDFLSDILLDSPGEVDRCGEVVDASNDKSWNVSDDGGSEKDKIDVSEKENNNGGDDDDDEDHISKKRKRQLRNRDAAVRSRERKKMYVRDLEMKSRYLEGECRRLGRLLQCCYAENQALRLSLHKGKAFDASMSKQESAVLLLESLLLGSLLWFLGIMCLLPLPGLLRSVPEAVSLENVDHKEDQGSLAPRRAGSKISGFWVLKSFIMSKRCKAARTKMKPSSLIYEVLV